MKVSKQRSNESAIPPNLTYIFKGLLTYLKESSSAKHEIHMLCPVLNIMLDIQKHYRWNLVDNTKEGTDTEYHTSKKRVASNRENLDGSNHLQNMEHVTVYVLIQCIDVH